MAKLARRRKLFSGKLRADHAKLRGFDKPQRLHVKHPMPIPASKIVKDPKVESALDEASAWVS